MPRSIPPELRKQLKYLDDILAVEKFYLDNPDLLDSTDSEKVEDDMEERFKEERGRGGIRQAELDYEGE